jgi:thiol-disulfide isomerase/thioredoxin
MRNRVSKALLRHTAVLLFPLCALPSRAVDAQTLASGKAPPAMSGQAAPQIELRSLDGKKVKLSSLRGRPVVLSFWGTWCPPCRDEFPELVALHRKYGGDGLVVLAVNQRDQETSTSAVQDFVKEFGAEFTVLLDERGKSRRGYRLTALPTTIFIDAAGTIRAVSSGPTSRAALLKGLATVLPAR